jgi:hypothetical protein
LCMGSSRLFAQMQKIVVYSNVECSFGEVDYGDLKKLLPDSITAKLLIDPKKTYGLKKPYDVLLWMSTNGWKLVTTALQSSYYMMSKDIYLDKPAYDLYISKLTSSNKK